jgi:serine/threonine protein phosphatase PrpC
MTLQVRGVGLTDIGRVRRRNEDAFYLPEDGIYGVVADGMGGGPAGDVAAETAVGGVVRYLNGVRSALETATGGSRDELLRLHVEAAVSAANDLVLARGDADPAVRGMGCTLTVLLLDPISNRFAIGHVGDSRAYRLAQHGAIEQLTDDHTLAQESVERGRLTVEAARDHPFGHILTRVIGLDHDVECQTVCGSKQPGDTFLLCTDGLIRVLEDEELSGALQREDDLTAAAQWLVEEANRRGGPDNATLVLMRLDQD